MRRFLLIIASLTILASCGAPSGVLVSETARSMGGSLFIETNSEGDSFLVLDGEITQDTAAVFAALVEDADIQGLVIAQSPGGDLIASHQIGRTIKAQKMNTVVLVSCISACVDIFVAGRNREIADIAELGMHAATNPEISYEIDRRYWREMGLSQVNEKAYQVPNEKLWIIDAQRARELRMATDILVAPSA